MGRSGFNRMFKQDITFWQSNAVDKHGNTTWRLGTQVKGRWQDKIEQVQNKDGELVMSKSIIYLPGTQVIEEDWRMALGCVADSNPDEMARAYRVIAVGDSPDMRDRKSLRKVWLA